MGSTTVRISEQTRATLRELAEKLGEPMHAVLEQAVEAYRRERFFADLDAAYAALRSDPSAWREELEERSELDGALADDLGEP